MPSHLQAYLERYNFHPKAFVCYQLQDRIVVVPCSGVVCPVRLEQVLLPTLHIVLSLCLL